MANDENRSNFLSSRFNAWWLLTAFSIVVLTAVSTQTKDLDRDAAQKWALAAPSVTLALGALATLAHGFARDRFVGTPIEGGLVTLCLGFWAGGLPVIMNPDNDIAVTTGGGVLNANIYFFSWGAFASVLVLSGSFAREMMEVESPRPGLKRTLWWFALCAASLVVMASASRVFRNPDGSPVSCKDSSITDSDYCRRTKLGVSLGVVSAVIALVMSLVCSRLHCTVEAFVAVIMLIMWCFAVGYDTFGDNSPATSIGNFYFSTWACFILSLLLAADSINESYRVVIKKETVQETIQETPATAPKESTTTSPTVTAEYKV